MLVTAESMKISDFDNLISADNLVLIDFYATWCGACGAIDGALDRLVFSMGDVITLVRIDTTSRTSYDLVRRYNVVALPTLMLFQRSEVLWRECGVITYERLAHVIRRYRSVGAY
jgi:thioredoxin 1